MLLLMFLMLLLIIGAKVATAAADTFQEVRLKKSFIAISMKLEKAKKSNLLRSSLEKEFEGV